MGIISNCSLIGIFFTLCNVFTLSSVVSGIIYVINNFNDFSCGKLNRILIGIATLFIDGKFNMFFYILFEKNIINYS